MATSWRARRLRLIVLNRDASIARDMTRPWLERIVFRVVPAVVLATAFAGICVMTGTAWPVNSVVHEDGVRTLGGTILYFEHGARELLPDLILAMAVAGATRFFFPPTLAMTAAAQTSRARFGIVTAVVVAGILGGTAWTGGSAMVLDNLSQSHTRAGAPLVWGAHWRYHLLERLAQILLAFAVVGAIWVLRRRPETRPSGRRDRLLGTAVVLFGIATIAFRLTSEPFREPTFLGHQLRELFTHTLVTLPLALGTCLALARRWAPSRALGSRDRVWPIVAAAAAAVACGVFLLVASVRADAQSHGQAAGLAALLLPHLFEHSFGYVLVPAAAGLLYLWPRPSSRKGAVV